MVLGIGGCTVDELKARMSYAEALDWQSYIERRGTLNVGMRLEAGFALIAMVINRALGGSATVKDFMPHYEEPEATIGDVMSILAGSKK
jgi:hypothetical protein